MTDDEDLERIRSKTRAFDAAEYINNEDEARHFLEEIERDVPADMLEDVRAQASETVERARKRWEKS